MGLGFGNPLLYANQPQLARRQRWCGRSWRVYSTLSFSANLQLQWLWEGKPACNITILHLFLWIWFPVWCKRWLLFLLFPQPASTKPPLSPNINHEKGSEGELKHFHQQQQGSSFWRLFWFKRAHDCRCWLPPRLIYSACGGAAMAVRASLHTLVIFHACKVVWWVHWQPVGPTAGSPKGRAPLGHWWDNQQGSDCVTQQWVGGFVFSQLYYLNAVSLLHSVLVCLRLLLICKFGWDCSLFSSFTHCSCQISNIIAVSPQVWLQPHQENWTGSSKTSTFLRWELFIFRLG